MERIKHHVKNALGSEKALPVLGGLSFAESFIVPIITDPFLVLVIAARPARWIRAVLVTTVSSVGGALAAYALGYFFWGIVGESILNYFHAGEAFTKMSSLAVKGAFLFPLIGTMMPIPFKITAIVAGVFGLNPILFALAAFIGRGARYLFVGYTTAFATKKITQK